MYRIAEKRFLNSTVAEMKIEAPMVAKRLRRGSLSFSAQTKAESAYR